MIRSGIVAYLVTGYFAISAFAVDIPGVVKSATKKYATVVGKSDLIPVLGDKATIYFKMRNSDIEVSVGDGHVYEVTSGNIMIQFDNASAAGTNW